MLNLNLYNKESTPVGFFSMERNITVKKSYIGDERIFFITSNSVNLSVPANTTAGLNQVHSILVNLIDRGEKLNFVNTSFREISSECVSEFTANLIDTVVEKVTGHKIDSDELGSVLCQIRREKNAGCKGAC